jgi:hypothetical protein
MASRKCVAACFFGMIALFAPAPALAADLRPETAQVWEQYVRGVSARNQIHLVAGYPYPFARRHSSARKRRAKPPFTMLWRGSVGISGRTGKKVIVVFTDGDDNSSTLAMDAAVLRVKAASVPVYAIAQGGSVGAQQGGIQVACAAYVTQPADRAAVTGGKSFAVNDAS